MNIFVLSKNPVRAAQYHCDKHVVKMVLEYAQIVCTNLSLYGIETPYRKTHVNHPCTVWARQTKENHVWFVELFIALAQEYNFRYGKTHKSFETCKHLLKNNPFPEGALTKWHRAMPDYCKRESVVESYRICYMNEKTELLKWTEREIPAWLNAENL